ncbi:MAG: acetate uptake transporter [Sedimentisphaerales bacterium]|nr:acetate uptake transporter [Sedimentisphaerales bacterium]MBN2842191.1 acetate uptake transporter [Sedimentisphaerales bacterium]
MINTEKLANPAPLGLMGFGMTTILLNIHNAGFFADISPMVLAMGLFYGGMAQVIAGVLEFKKGNTFGLTAFTSYGMFWLSLVALVLMPKIFPDMTPTPPAFMGCYLSMWGIFTLFMFFGTLKANRALQVVFGSLVVLFALLAVKDFTGSKTLGIIAGYEGIFCGASAIYLAMAEVLNDKFGFNALPVGSVDRPDPRPCNARQAA